MPEIVIGWLAMTTLPLLTAKLTAALPPMPFVIISVDPFWIVIRVSPVVTVIRPPQKLLPPVLCRAPWYAVEPSPP